MSWQLIGTAPGAFTDPKDLPAKDWKPAIVPGTVAQSLGLTSEDSAELDAKDWWYRGTIETTPGKKLLSFEGLATIADVWLNGKKLFTSRNMFHVYEVSAELLAKNEIAIRFASLDAELAAKKPRPRWKTFLISQQGMRWIRTTLLGRISAWSPQIAPIGPWKAIKILDKSPPGAILTTQIRDGSPFISVMFWGGRDNKLTKAELHVGKSKFPLKIETDEITQDFSLPSEALWWPHTHGEPALTECRIETDCGTIDLGKIGFKSVEMNDGKISINGVPVFCRGACWTVSDFITLVGNEKDLRKSLMLAKEAGLNMLRVGGTMTYETDEFYRLCDELGILVWQDFMFANMDYPVTDTEFRAEIEAEAIEQVARLQKHACIAVYCGGSEVQQQSAMMGRPKEEWSNEFFDKKLPELCRKFHPGIPYVPSSPFGGDLPFHVGNGIAHYFGVGAYRRPLTDVKYAAVQFASECLAFSNISESFPANHPDWKSRVPRDKGADWDFEDVRDHYLNALTGLDPAKLRQNEPARYLELSKKIPGEVMKTVFAEWRKPGSKCGGGLIWFFKDLRPGPGWGILDSTNQPKSVMTALKRAWAAQAILMTDEGLDGLKLHAFNDSNKPLSATVGFEVFDQDRKLAEAERKVELSAHDAKSFGADELLGYFFDLTYSYKFGPPKHDLVRAYLKSEGRLIAEDFYFPNGLK